MSERTERALLAAILVAFAALATTYSVVVPPFEASDELWHYPMVKTIADNWRLPVQDPADVGPWRQEGSQPPLYYFLGALATTWSDTSEMDQARHLNVHVDNGVATLDGNTNLVVHDPALESFPWRGTVLAVHVVRLLSVAMSTAAVCLTWLIVREVAPGQPGLALTAAAIHAFTPMYVFISGAINNDNLVVPLSSLALLMLIRLVKDAAPGRGTGGPGEAIGPGRQSGSRWPRWRAASGAVPIRRYLMLGVVLGLAALTKTSSLALTVVTAVVVIVRAVRRRSWAEFFGGGLGSLLPVLLIAAWWYLRNLRLYGDISGLNIFIEILGKRDVPADIAQLWRERFSFAAGYWGNFGGLNVPLPNWAYRTLNWLTILAAAGLVLRMVQWAARRLSLHTRLSRLASEAGSLRPWPVALCLLWGIGVVIPWSQWASVTWSSQGRLVFAAIPVWSMLLAMGLAALLPRHCSRWLLTAIVLLLFALASCAPLLWIGPAYALPEPLGPDEMAAIPHPLQVKYRLPGTEGEAGRAALQLLGYDVSAHAVEPGSTLDVTLYWEALAPTDQDHTVFVHLLGEGKLLVAQRDTFPGIGLLSSTWLEPGYRWSDRYVLVVPETAFAPDAAQIEVGVYETDSGARLAATGPSGENLGDHIRFAQVEVRRPSADLPNQIAVSFGDQIALVGYDLDRRVARPGEEISLILYWEGLRPMLTDYTVSAQVVDSEQRKAAQVDGWLQSGTSPTTSMEPGRIIVDGRTLAVFPDAAPGVYDVRVAVYWLEDGEIRHLPIVRPGGQMLADHIILTQARIAPP